MLVNTKKALDLLGGNTQIYQMLLTSFLNNSGFPELVSDFESGDIQKAIQSSHKIRGASGNLALDDLYTNLSALETSLRGNALDHALYQTCVESFEKTKEEINRLLAENAL